MSGAVQLWRPKGEYELPRDDEIEVEEIVDDENEQHSAVGNDENHSGQGAAFVDPRSDTRTRASYTETDTRNADGRQEDQQEPLYSFPRPRVHIRRNSYGSYTEASAQRMPPHLRVHIRRTSHGSYTEAAPPRASPPPPTRARTTPINYLERPMRYFDHHEGGRQTRYYFHHYDDAGNQVWWPESRLPSSNRTGTGRSETFPQGARGVSFRTAEGRDAFRRYLTGSEPRMIERRENLARQSMPESTSARNVWASQMVRQSGARNREEAYHRRRDRNQY
ncbi:hypothetical protein OCU04_009299 [Sclerotinia nivalis]|uniref:Uncharacterized protein n=1 Tax=Sclerotinia nivalis TaxID=352851 RepID=A0A9X0AER1_9HELO|nr:hypothetical protein OCU04_009299 [Sclerotinia nivalis]